MKLQQASFPSLYGMLIADWATLTCTWKKHGKRLRSTEHRENTQSSDSLSKSYHSLIGFLLELNASKYYLFCLSRYLVLILRNKLREMYGTVHSVYVAVK